MSGRELFEIWAPTGKRWVDWVRPVPFVEIKDHSKNYRFSEWEEMMVGFLDEDNRDAAIIVDLPGDESVAMGIALARNGYRPIPIFNGTIEPAGARATVDNQAVGVALSKGAQELQKIEIADEALPAFLTDSNRLNRFKMEAALFDNSWDVYHQDLPSAEYFLRYNIGKIIVVGDFWAGDLKKILYGYQKKGMEIFFTKGYEIPKKKKLHKPLRKEKD